MKRSTEEDNLLRSALKLAKAYQARVSGSKSDKATQQAFDTAFAAHQTCAIEFAHAYEDALGRYKEAINALAQAGNESATTVPSDENGGAKSS